MSLENRIHRARAFTNHFVSRTRDLPFENTDLERYLRCVATTPQLSQMATRIELRRSQLLKNSETVEIPSSTFSGTPPRKRTISDLAKEQLSSKRFAPLLSRTAAFFEAGTILELGSGVGISGSYLATDNPSAKILTLEECPVIAKAATESYRELSLDNIECIAGEFTDTLTPALETLDRVDFAVLQGRHGYRSTIRFFREVFPYTTESSLMVFDDIHWSPEMTIAWREILESRDRSLVFDFHSFGVVFLDPALPRQVVTLKP